MRRPTRPFLILMVLFPSLRVLAPAQGFAYVEYAVRYNMVSCRACHYNPAGGGPRTVAGKLFGAHSYSINSSFVNIQQFVSADFRALYYVPQRAAISKDGMGIMAATLAGHVALDEDQTIQLVIEHNLAGFSAAFFRDTYALFSFKGSRWFESLLIGRFRSPFGFVTDEHRTYTRVQSATEWYTFETGLMASGTPVEKFHYDLAAVSGENATGDSLAAGRSDVWGTIVNARWMPGPILVGLSGSYHRHHPDSQSREALSLYSLISFARWTQNQIPISLALEQVMTWNWDSHLGNGFANDPSYVAALRNAVAQGYLTRLEWMVNERFTFIYKFDWLTPDRSFPADYYSRHGVGFRWFIGPNTAIQARTEWARATPPSETGAKGEGGQNATYGLLQLAF
jgi:hypothetical protein